MHQKKLSRFSDLTNVKLAIDLVQGGGGGREPARTITRLAVTRALLHGSLFLPQRAQRSIGGHKGTRPHGATTPHGHVKSMAQDKSHESGYSPSCRRTLGRDRPSRCLLRCCLSSNLCGTAQSFHQGTTFQARCPRCSGCREFA